MRVAVANGDLLEPVLLRVLAGSPRSNATIRTTTAVTMVHGGDQGECAARVGAARW